MRIIPAALLAASLLASSSVLAQNAPAAGAAPAANRDAPANKALNTRDENNPGAPAAGRNSFTESQARARLERDGYTSISGLKKDDNGVWRGEATKNGQAANVAVDYQGNIVPR